MVYSNIRFKARKSTEKESGHLKGNSSNLHRSDFFGGDTRGQGGWDGWMTTTVEGIIWGHCLLKGDF